jgi:hypothetical protein
VEPVREDTREGTVTYKGAVGVRQYLKVFVYALAGTDVPLLDPQQGLLSLPGLNLVVVQFALHIEPLFQSGAVGGMGPGRRPFLLIAGGNDFGGSPLHSATECTETRGDLTQVSIHSNRDPSGAPMEEG